MKRFYAPYVSWFWILTLAVSTVNATTYKSKVTNGTWTTASSWVGNSKPGNTVNSGDSVIIVTNSNITLNADITVQGIMIIETNASLKGYGNKIDVGDGNNTGMLFNHGTLHCEKIDVKGVDKTPIEGLPLLYNYDTLITGKIHTGTNGDPGVASSGKTINASTGYLVISKTLGSANGEFHVDGKVENCGAIYAEKKVKLHGSEITCCGSLYTPLVEFDDNKGRPGELICQNVCQGPGGSSTTWDVKEGGSYASLQAMTDNEGSGSGGKHTDNGDFMIDSSDTYDCLASLEGGAFPGGGNPLPVELINFKAKNGRYSVLVSWSTTSETNNSHFVLERSRNGQDWQLLNYVNGAGSTSEISNYTYTDGNPFENVVYYRLSQVDFDGAISSFPVIQLSKTWSGEPKIFKVYPNPAISTVNVELNLQEAAIVSLFDLHGQTIEIQPKNNPSGLKFSVANLPKGQYIIEIISDSNYSRQQLIVR